MKRIARVEALWSGLAEFAELEAAPARAAQSEGEITWHSLVGPAAALDRRAVVGAALDPARAIERAACEGRVADCRRCWGRDGVRHGSCGCGSPLPGAPRRRPLSTTGMKVISPWRRSRRNPQVQGAQKTLVKFLGNSPQAKCLAQLRVAQGKVLLQPARHAGSTALAREMSHVGSLS